MRWILELSWQTAPNIVPTVLQFSILFSNFFEFEDLKNSRTDLTDGAEYRSNEGEEDGWSREKKEERGGGLSRGGGLRSGGGLSSGWWCGPGWNKTIQHIA